MICEKYKQISFLTCVQLSLVVCICGGGGVNYQMLGSLPQTTNLVVCICGGQGGKLPMTWNGQICLIHNFSNLFPLKWFRMTQNSQICPICNFSNRIHVNLGKNNILSVFNLTRRSTRSVLTINT